MKKLFYLLGILMLLPSVLAINLNVTTLTDDAIMIHGLNDPTIFKVNVTNLGPTDKFSFYTFFGSGMEPKDDVLIERGETKELELKFYPRQDLKYSGYTIFSYFIQDSHQDEIEEKLKLKIIDLADAFEVGASMIDPDSEELTIYLRNKVNFNFDKIDAKFSSAFFDEEKTFSLGPYEEAEFKIKLNKDDFAKLMAGYYTLSANIDVENVSADVSGKIEFKEKKILDTEVKKYGLIVFTKVFRTENKGNVVGTAEVRLKRNIITRLFTTMSPEPTQVERKKSAIYYSWEKDLEPGEVYEVSVKTNWLLPFVVIFLVALLVIIIKKYSQTDLILKKKVSFVKAKGGEFALKVTIFVEAREYVEKVVVRDRLPPLVKVYGRFGGEIPARYHKGKKVFEWDFEELEAGEKRVLSYIIYSKVGVLGKFALPSTKATFKREGKSKVATSNKVYFLAQQKDEADIE